MEPLKPKELQPNQGEESEEALQSFEESESEQKSEYIEQKPLKTETGFNIDKAKTAQPQGSQDQNTQNGDTNSQPISNQVINNDNPTKADTFVEEILMLDISTTKQGKKARDELYKKAAKAQS